MRTSLQHGRPPLLFEDYSHVKTLREERKEKRYLDYVTNTNDTLFYITDLVVDPEFQNAGIASQLMEELNRIISSKGAAICLSIIYDVKMQDDDNIMTNKSMRLLKKYSGMSVGHLKKKLIEIGHYRIEIFPNLVIHEP